MNRNFLREPLIKPRFEGAGLQPRHQYAANIGALAPEGAVASIAGDLIRASLAANAEVAEDAEV
jgi:hypothetical protein